MYRPLFGVAAADFLGFPLFEFLEFFDFFEPLAFALGGVPFGVTRPLFDAFGVPLVMAGHDRRATGLRPSSAGPIMRPGVGTSQGGRGNGAGGDWVRH